MICDNDVRTFLRQQQGVATADTASSAGNDGKPAVKT